MRWCSTSYAARLKGGSRTSPCPGAAAGLPYTTAAILENFMAFQWMRRALTGLAAAALLLLGACGSSIESQFHPTRAIAFGDGFSDAGQTGAKYTVNDGSLSWVQHAAASYGVTMTPAAQGGTAYATGNARVVAKPD